MVRPASSEEGLPQGTTVVKFFRHLKASRRLEALSPLKLDPVRLLCWRT
jgi:hypothetical protein